MRNKSKWGRPARKGSRFPETHWATSKVYSHPVTESELQQLLFLLIRQCLLFIFLLFQVYLLGIKVEQSKAKLMAVSIQHKVPAYKLYRTLQLYSNEKKNKELCCVSQNTFCRMIIIMNHISVCWIWIKEIYSDLTGISFNKMASRKNGGIK